MANRTSRRNGRAAVLGVITAALLATSAHAATLTVWWNKGFYPAEDKAMDDVVKAWEKKTGNKVNLSYYSTSDIATKFVSALTAGQVPDVAYSDLNDFLITPQQAWKGNLVDVSSIVEPLKDEYTKTALMSSYLYNDKLHKRSYYTVPLKQQALHNFYWRPLIEEAGFTEKDIPDTWDAYWEFWAKVQKKLRDKGQRIYALGFPLSTVDTDNFYTFNQFALAYGAHFVNPDGTLNLRKETRDAAIKTLTFFKTEYDKGLIPSSALNWGDPDNNAAFFSKQIIMTSERVAFDPGFEGRRQGHVLQPDPHGHDAQGSGRKDGQEPRRGQGGLHPEGRQAGRPREELPVVPRPAEEARRDAAGSPGTLAAGHAEVAEGRSLLDEPEGSAYPCGGQAGSDRPDGAWPMAYNPAYAQVNAEEVWGKAEGDVINNGVSPEKAVDTAFSRIKEIFAQYKINK